MSGSALSIKKGLQTSIKQFLGIAVWIIVTVFEYLFLSGLTNSSEYLQIISWIILANMIGQIITWKSCGKKLVSFFMLILLFLYIFHFGQVVMNGLLPSYTYDYMDYVSVYMLDTNLKIYTLLVSILTINFMAIHSIKSIMKLIKNPEIIQPIKIANIFTKDFLKLAPDTPTINKMTIK